MTSLAIITDTLRVANRELAQQAWTWRLLSTTGGRVTASSGLTVETDPLDDHTCDITLLLASYKPEAALEKSLLSWLRRRDRSGVFMGCVDTGALIFAEAGLLTKIPAAVHFETISGYRDRFPTQLFVDRMYHISEHRCSSAGGAATFDMMLGVIERFSDRDLSIRIAEILIYRPTELEGPQQRMLLDTTLMRLDPNLARAIELMLIHLQEPLPIKVIARRVELPEWTLARLFKRHLKSTPSEYYRHLRLSEARNLLRNSSYRIGEIGGLCGFDNPESFARAYRRNFGYSASMERKLTESQKYEARHPTPRGITV